MTIRRNYGEDSQSLVQFSHVELLVSHSFPPSSVTVQDNHASVITAVFTDNSTQTT